MEHQARGRALASSRQLRRALNDETGEKKLMVKKKRKPQDDDDRWKPDDGQPKTVHSSSTSATSSSSSSSSSSASSSHTKDKPSNNSKKRKHRSKSRSRNRSKSRSRSRKNNHRRPVKKKPPSQSHNYGIVNGKVIDWEEERAKNAAKRIKDKKEKLMAVMQGDIDGEDDSSTAWTHHGFNELYPDSDAEDPQPQTAADIEQERNWKRSQMKQKFEWQLSDHEEEVSTRQDDTGHDRKNKPDQKERKKKKKKKEKKKK